ncbi:cytochrome b/b6 domain-containing protein [Comamonas sp. NLF-1-9]|uniref:cytochrome b/b6 domain-containing protein n=1 Tax=Comamonas sp. NLF-1-9 TaxID=2853163 RepID=UPI001C490AC4|nr:cytochrome b/b6 domain-containing protein [Comamonas sp. NLF-1-9]QXL84164.1 cytochrome b/b6 domain-containing protein [Comamonas sp. NLF-1-9]
MWFFKQARDYYGNAPLSQQLAWQVGVALLFLVLAFIGYHLLRRALRRPHYAAQGALPPAEANSFVRFKLGGRAYHWGIFLIIVLLLLSGATFFFPGALFAIRDTLGVSWLTVHVVLGWLFIVFVALHILFAIFDTGLHHMLFHRGDGEDFRQRVRFYLGADAALPKHGKFNVFQKLYHLFLILTAAVMIVTGIVMFLSSELFTTFSGDTMRLQRLFHDSFAFLLLAAICGHVYMRLLGARRAKLRSMVTGTMPRQAFVREHDWRKWKP